MNHYEYAETSSLEEQPFSADSERPWRLRAVNVMVRGYTWERLTLEGLAERKRQDKEKEDKMYKAMSETLDIVVRISDACEKAQAECERLETLLNMSKVN